MTAIAQRNFAAGEVSPSIGARVDMVKYQSGLATCRNFTVQRWGGVASRAGTRFIGEVKDSTKTVRLIPFIFNPSQAYALEFGDLYMRVIKNGAQVLETAVPITGIAQANPAVVTALAHGYANGQEVNLSGIVGMTQLNGRNFKVAGATLNTFQLRYMNDSTSVNSATFGAYVSDGVAARVFTLTTTYLEADLQDLDYVQSADVLTIVHPSYQPREVARISDANWTIADISFVPSIAAPTGPAAVNGTAGAVVWRYKVTAIKTETYEESLPTAKFSCTGGTPTSAAPNTLSWTASANAVEYDVYKEVVPGNGVFGFIGVAESVAFNDPNIPPDQFKTPPVARDPFAGADNKPSAVTYYQQRLGLANLNSATAKAFFSRTGAFKNFTIRSPLQDDDAVTFEIVGQQVNEIAHMLDLSKLILFTSGGEYVINGDSAGTLLPAEINSRQQSFNGSAPGRLKPIVIAGDALYVQARGTVIRSLAFEFASDSYRGNDLTVFSAHLFDQFTLRDWTFQQIPHSVAWIVRSDGTMLGLTYIREHQIWGWHRHDFQDATVEQVCSIPEGSEDALYVVVRRTIPGLYFLGGTTRRYIERLQTRLVGDIVDYFAVDSGMTYQGSPVPDRPGPAPGISNLTGGTNWDYTETLTLNCFNPYFLTTDIGDQVWLQGDDGTIIKFNIAGGSGATITGSPTSTVPASMQSPNSVSIVALATKHVGGLWHLEGENISALGDGFVAANPNNPTYGVVTVAGGIATFATPYAVIHVGKPITCDFETLDIDSAQGETMMDKRKQITRVTLYVEKSRGIFIGPDTDHLTEAKLREDEPYADPVALKTGVVDVDIVSDWNRTGRIFVRQVDPVPLTVLAATPTGFVPLRG